MAAGYEKDETHMTKKLRESKIIPIETVFFPGSVNFPEYFMTYRKKGKCIIFNHKFFSCHEPRYGTDFDVTSLNNQFKALGFEVEIFTNLTVCQVQKKLIEAGKEDYTDSSCFVCCILTYGECGYLYAFDEEYPVENVFSPFQSDVCPSLAGKPKMFFIQACQGGKLEMEENTVCKEFLDCNFRSKFPSGPDFLIVCSTLPGAYSSVLSTQGSWFIQALCDGIEEYAKSKDILSILTIVNRKVAYDFEIYKYPYQSKDTRKLVPLIASTLTRDVRFL